VLSATASVKVIVAVAATRPTCEPLTKSTEFGVYAVRSAPGDSEPVITTSSNENI